MVCVNKIHCKTDGHECQVVATMKWTDDETKETVNGCAKCVKNTKNNKLRELPKY